MSKNIGKGRGYEIGGKEFIKIILINIPRI